MTHTLTIRQQIELFIQRAEELSKLKYIQNRTAFQFTMILNTKDDRLFIESEEPDIEEVRSFLLLFRQFISNKEPIFINSIFNHCERNIRDDNIKNHIRDYRKQWIFIYTKMSDFEVEIDGKNINTAYILNLWINGDIFHNDPKLKKELEKMSRSVIPLDRMQLFTTLPKLAEVIITLGRDFHKFLEEGHFIFIDGS